MSADEMRWLLRTISDAETAKRFVEAQYRRGRISIHAMAGIDQEQPGAELAVVGALTAKLPRELGHEPASTRQDRKSVV